MPPAAKLGTSERSARCVALDERIRRAEQAVERERQAKLVAVCGLGNGQKGGLAFEQGICRQILKPVGIQIEAEFGSLAERRGKAGP